MLIFKIIYRLLSVCFLCAVLGVSLLLIVLDRKLPNVDVLKKVTLQVPMRIFSEDGLLIAEYGDKRLDPIPLDAVPNMLKNAVLATEDIRFYQHPGVDYRGLMRAFFKLLRTRSKEQGGSTITMQVARNFFLSRHKTFLRKINEILLAFRIEKALTKDEILELYLNKIYFGKKAYGVAAAAQVYYGKGVNELTLAQMATLAGLPQAPSSINPIHAPEEAYKRRMHVLTRMLNYKLITQQEFNQAVKEPETAKYHPRSIELFAPHIAEMVRQKIIELYGYDAYEQGFEVVTTINSNYQKAANIVVAKALLEYDAKYGYKKYKVKNFQKELVQGKRTIVDLLQAYPKVGPLFSGIVQKVFSDKIEVSLGGSTIVIPWSGLKWARENTSAGDLKAYPTTAFDIVALGDLVYVRFVEADKAVLSQVPEVEGALVSLNAEDGAIRALVGGFDYQQSAFNRVVQAERQPGSAFKPFLYAAALEKGFTAASLINDAPIVREINQDGEIWRPQNSTKKFYGPTRLREALTYSRNLVTIRVLQSMGIDHAIEYLAKIGFDRNNLPRNLTLALGTNQVTPLNLAAGYCLFANGGYKISPFFIKVIKNAQQMLYTSKPVRVTTADKDAISLDEMAPQVISAQHAYIMNSILKDVVERGTAKSAKQLNRHDLGGKTGSTQNHMDSWFAGFNRDLVTVTWMGFDEPRTLHEYAAKTALPIWINFMRIVLHGQEEKFLAKPEGIVTVAIDPKTGLLAEADQAEHILEIFTQDSVPDKQSVVAENVIEDESIF